ncbi:MAG TPA: hypothetical protein VIG33_12555 [Pseudobdellovibrionaceae bacterium]|jgi:hypothetical protein
MNKAKSGFFKKNKKRVVVGLATILWTTINPFNFLNQSFAESNVSSSNVSFLKKVVQDLNIQVSLSSVAGIKGSNPELDVTQQNLAVKISNQDAELMDVLRKNLGTKQGYSLQEGFIMQVRLAGTVSPLIVGGKTRKDAIKAVDAEVEEGAAQKREALYQMAPKMVEDGLRAKITAAVNSNPNLNMLTAGQKAQLIDGQVKQNLPAALQTSLPLVHKQIDAQVAQAVPGIKAAMEEDHVNSRMSQLELETGIQTLDATIGIPINPLGNMSDTPPGLILFSFGKAHPMLGAELKANGLSQWENILGHASEAERGNTVSATGYSSIGIAYSLTKDINLMVNIIGYHDRDPWMSAQQYIQQSLAVSKAVFNKYQDVTALNALALSMRADAKLNKSLTGQFWATITNRFDPTQGDQATGYSFGGTITNEKSKTMLNFAYAHSGKAYFNETYSIGIAQTILDKKTNSWVPGVIVFTDFRGIKQLANVNVLGSVASETKLVALGSKVDICKYVDQRLKIDCALVGEYQKLVQQSGGEHPSDDFYVGLSANAAY